jgi:hypothetical protein
MASLRRDALKGSHHARAARSALATLLGQINVIEHDHGRPLLSAVVLTRTLAFRGLASGTSPRNSESTSVGATSSAKVSGSSRCANATCTGAIARCEVDADPTESHQFWSSVEAVVSTPLARDASHSLRGERETLFPLLSKMGGGGLEAACKWRFLASWSGTGPARTRVYRTVSERLPVLRALMVKNPVSSEGRVARRAPRRFRDLALLRTYESQLIVTLDATPNRVAV